MLLTINVGNTNIAFGLFRAGKLVRDGWVPAAEFLTLCHKVGKGKVSRIVIGSVAPKLTQMLREELSAHFGVPILVAGVDLPFRMEIRCNEPGKVGADRVLNAMAAHARTRGAAIVADVGTAITVDLVSKKGAFCGGAIAPGPRTMLRALHDYTELLPEVSLEKPVSQLGLNTTEAMRSGAWYGAAAIVQTLAARIGASQRPRPRLFVTGGSGQYIARELKATFIPTLTLEGLAILV